MGIHPSPFFWYITAPKPCADASVFTRCSSFLSYLPNESIFEISL
uniref:Uncharacterized protein n=1 Tax=Lepeophtheirus salmonis TaxID=72036 RepID=A0A0K2TGA5_LEPSM